MKNGQNFTLFKAVSSNFISCYMPPKGLMLNEEEIFHGHFICLYFEVYIFTVTKVAMGKTSLKSLYIRALSYCVRARFMYARESSPCVTKTVSALLTKILPRAAPGWL